MKEKPRKNLAASADYPWLGSSQMEPLQAGQLVQSKKGRDRGAFYLVLAVQGNLALAADGRKRGVANPKKKNRRHLQATGKVAADLAQRLKAGESISNGEIREIITGFCKAHQVNDKEV